MGSKSALLFLLAVALQVFSEAAFCESSLYTSKFVCDDGGLIDPSKKECCSNDRCPSTCRGSSWGSGGCTCTGCNREEKLALTSDQKYLKAHNYFRCRHGYEALEWDATVAQNARNWASKCNFQHSESYKYTPRSGENLAMGQGTEADAVEDWYTEVTDIPYDRRSDCRGPGGVGHYTALIWKSTTKLGCGFTDSMNVCSGKRLHVCNYANNAPNMGGQYCDNVPASNTPTATEEQCCATVYAPQDIAGTPSLNKEETNAGVSVCVAKAGLGAMAGMVLLW